MPKKEKNDPKYFEYVFMIKHRLNEKCPIMEDGVQEGISSIVKGLNAMGYNFSRSMVEGTLNERISSLNTIVVLALCKYWNINTSYVFAPPEITTPEEIALSSFHVESDDFKSLDSSAYMGTFYCYLYSRNNGDRNLWNAEINFHNSGNITTATLTIFERDKERNVSKTKVMKGLPYLSTISNNVIILFKNEQGSFAIVTFNYSPYVTGQMKYRIASFLSYSLEYGKLPRMQKMLMLREKAKPASMEYIHGLLKMEQGHALIRKEDLDALVKKHPSLQSFMKDYAKQIEANHYDFYDFNDSILSSLTKDYDREDIENLLLLKSASIEPDYIEIPLNGYMREFSKNL